MDDNPHSSIFIQAIVDQLKKGVYEIAIGRDSDNPLNMFVDHALMVDTCRNMIRCMAVSIWAHFLIMGELSERERRSLLSMEINLNFPCSWEEVQFNIFIDTRRIMLSLSDDKIEYLNDTLTSTWYRSRKSFTILEGLTLLGHLERASIVYSWGWFLLYVICGAVNSCLDTRVRCMSYLI